MRYLKSFNEGLKDDLYWRIDADEWDDSNFFQGERHYYCFTEKEIKQIKDYLPNFSIEVQDEVCYDKENIRIVHDGPVAYEIGYGDTIPRGHISINEIDVLVWKNNDNYYDVIDGLSSMWRCDDMLGLFKLLEVNK